MQLMCGQKKQLIILMNMFGLLMIGNHGEVEKRLLESIKWVKVI